MLRLLSGQCLHELRKYSHLVASCVTKRSFGPVRSACHHRLYPLTRHLNTGNPVWKDAHQPKADKPEELQTVDLDKWKSVMRAQAASEEKQQVNDEVEASDDDENLKEAAGDSKDRSLLEATRDLVEMWRYAGKSVPQEMTDEELQELAELTTKSSRKRYLKYLAIKEDHKRARKEKQAKRKAEREVSMEQRRGEDSSAEEREFKNTIFLQFWRRSLDKVLAWRSAQSMMFGQPLVYDLSYDSNMSKQELKNTVSQLMDVEGYNRRATEPFHLHFCNLQPGGAYQQELLNRYGAETWDRLFITSTDRHHVDVFPHEQLVYLTADSPNVLRKFDHSKVYIIGALVDRSIQSGLSLANAKRLKLATARLPLDDFLNWEMGAKNLTLDQMIRIMLTLKETGNWEEALEFVPKRKHDGLFRPGTPKEMTYKKLRGPREDGEQWLRSGERTFKNEGHSRDRMARLPGDKTARTSLKNNLGERKGAGQRKMWWGDK